MEALGEALGPFFALQGIFPLVWWWWWCYNIDTPKEPTRKEKDMTSTIRHFAENAKTAREARILNAMADSAEAQKAAEAAMPEWAKACAVDVRVPVSVKVEHDGLEVESWTSKKGAQMHRVRWADGTETQYQGDLAKKYVEWNR